MPVNGILPDVIIHVFGIAGQSLLKPFMIRRCVIEDHVEHETDSVLLGLGDHFLDIFHRSEARVDRAIVRDIIPVVVLR